MTHFVQFALAIGGILFALSIVVASLLPAFARPGWQDGAGFHVGDEDQA